MYIYVQYKYMYKNTLLTSSSLMWQHCCLQSGYREGQWIKLGFFWPVLHRLYNLPPGKYSRLLSCAAFRLSRDFASIVWPRFCPTSSLSVIHKFDYVFAENGTVQYKDGRLLSRHVSNWTAPHSFYSTSRNRLTPCVSSLTRSLKCRQ